MKKMLGVLVCLLFIALPAGPGAVAGDVEQPAVKKATPAAKKTSKKPAAKKTTKPAAEKAAKPASGDAQKPDAGDAAKPASGGGTRVTLNVPILSPFFSKVPLALVNNEPVTAEEMLKVTGGAHISTEGEAKKAGEIDFFHMLDRVINTKLVVQEAVRIGLDEQPEFKQAAEVNEKSTLASLLMEDLTKDVKADPAEVEPVLKKMVEEWKVTSVLFEKEEAAKAAHDEIAAGKPFDEVAKKAIDDKKASGGGEGEFIKPQLMLPQVASALAALQPGGVSQVIKVEIGKEKRFAVVRLLEKRYPETAEARAEAEQAVLAQKRMKVVNEVKKDLFAKYVTIKDRKVDRLDYDSPKADLTELMTDPTVIAEIKQEKPVTVGDLTQALAEKFYHGLDEARTQKRINEAKRAALNIVIERRLVRSEAIRRGLNTSEQYREATKEFKDGFLFGMFVDKVVVPDVTITEDDMQAYFKKHEEEFKDPEMMKLVSLPFGNKRNAQAALAKLKQGTDINWVRANAEGLVATTDEEDVFLGGIITTKSMPRPLQETLAGAKQGDYRLYAGPDGRFYVLSIAQVIPSRLQPFDKVQKEVQNKVVEDKLEQALNAWFAKLRAASEIKIYMVKSHS